MEFNLKLFYLEKVIITRLHVNIITWHHYFNFLEDKIWMSKGAGNKNFFLLKEKKKLNLV